MRNLLVGGSLLLASVAAASAADLPIRSAAPAPMMAVPMVYNWSGFYMGLNAGGAWTTGCTNYGLTFAGAAYGEWNDQCRSSDTQFTGGAQVGYNFQAGSFVYGIEADINGVGNSNGGTRTVVVPGAGPLGGDAFRITGVGDPGVFGTVRARLGFAANRALFYVTGGLAWASGGNDPRVAWYNNGLTPVRDPEAVFSRGGRNDIGWTLGAGVEYAMTNNWTIRAEYLYVDLGKEDNAWNCAPAGAVPCTAATLVDLTGRKDVNFNVVRVGVNYKFGGGNSAPVLARY